MFIQTLHSSIVLNMEWVQFVFQNCEILLSEVCMIKTTPYITVSPQMWCIKSRLVYTPPDFVKQTCRTQTIRLDFFPKNLFFGPNLLWPRAIMALKCDRRWLLFFGCTYKAINLMSDLVHSWTVCKLFFSKLKSLSPYLKSRMNML